MCPSARTDQQLARLFKLMGDPTRLRILRVLLEGPRNVSQVVKALRVRQPTVSRHLALLRLHGLADSQRKGKEVHYRLTATTKRAVKSLLDRGQSLTKG